ncbi:MAG: hypothetical protein DRH26_02280 [Deltaproteobacteria bacterium]|nr:MAG: hypothetical protein DRH26_02280 [Deltaproteobacteria bacterium]
MKEIKDIIKVLENAKNESTESPYWLVLDPRQNMMCNVHHLAAQITGPFFCREDAEDYLESRSYAHSDKAVVYCLSGYWSGKYNCLHRALEGKS